MGFLTGLLGDLVGGQAGAMFQESVGVNPRSLRKLTRLVGGKNLAMLGAGAALGGAALAGGQETGSGPSAWQAPRGPATSPPAATPTAVQPPPPPPGATTEPAASPPPPPPGAGPEPTTVAEVEAAVSNELAYAITRAMVAAALADGHLDDREKTLVEGRLDESGFTDDQIAQIRRDLVLPPQPDELAAQITDVEARAAAFRFAGLVILAADGVSALERSWLGRLARAFGFDAERTAALESEIFAPDDFAPGHEV